MEYFKYMYDLLKEKGAAHIRIYGGGGGVIIPREIKELMITELPGSSHLKTAGNMGLQGMINRMMEECDFSTVKPIITWNILMN